MQLRTGHACTLDDIARDRAGRGEALTDEVQVMREMVIRLYPRWARLITGTSPLAITAYGAARVARRCGRRVSTW